MKIILNNIEYSVEKNYRDALDLELLIEKTTDYFEDYDYIVGDWAYGKLRLKGFYDNKNQKATNLNNYNNIDEYIKNYCAYDCKHFILKKNKKVSEKNERDNNNKKK